MNTKECLEQLGLILTSLSCHPRFLSELIELLKNDLSGKEAKFFTLLITQMNHIKDYSTEVNKVDGNEILKGAGKRFYSIHLKGSQFNVRFIIYFTKADKIPLFLCAFNERSGKKHTDYTQYVNVAQNRLQEMLGDEENE